MKLDARATMAEGKGAKHPAMCANTARARMRKEVAALNGRQTEHEPPAVRAVEVMMRLLQAMDLVRPGFRFSETVDGDDFTTVTVAGERGDEVLLRGGESPGWWAREDIARFILEASEQPPPGSRM